MSSAETAASALLMKVASTAGVALLGAAVMAAFDPPKSKKELFQHAAVAGSGSFIFGPAAHSTASHFLSTWTAGVDLTMPSYFLVGALSWGAMGALAKFRKLVSERGAAAIGKTVGMQEPPQEPK